MYKDSRLAEAAAQTALLEARVAHLGDLLNKMIAENGPLEPAMLVSRPVLPQFPPGALAVETAPPDPRRYGVPEPTGMGKVFSRARHAAAVAEANALYEQHRAQHAAQERDRQRRFADAESAHRREVDRLNGDYRAQIDSLQPIWRDAAAGSAHAIVVYNELLLSAVTGRASYPPDFPRQFRIAYTPESRQLTVEFDLPPATVIPPEKAYRYTAITDTISAAPRTATDAKRLYADAIAQTSLGIIYALFRGDSHQDHQGHTRHGFDTVVFNGVVDAIDPATGAAIRPCLVTTRATRDSFNQLDLRNVDPAACLRHLGASVSKSPAELVPVRPVLEFSMVDPRFIADTDVLGNLDTRTNLMELTPTQFESLITNLFSTMGLETRQTQASRDGGVDCVAYDPRPIFGGKVVIQAKRYKNTVGVSAVRDLYGTMQNEGASKGILVTTSGYGQASHQFAANKPLELIDGTGLLYLLAEHAGIDARIIPPDDWHDPEPDTRTD